jgi:hypothetical protein
MHHVCILSILNLLFYIPSKLCITKFKCVPARASSLVYIRVLTFFLLFFSHVLTLGVFVSLLDYISWIMVHGYKGKISLYDHK